MPEITICIEIDEKGQISVGQEPAEAEAAPEAAPAAPGAPAPAAPAQIPAGMDAQLVGGEEEGEKSYMQPVGSIDEALAKAKALLQAGGQDDQSQQAAAAQQAFGAIRGGAQ